MANYKVGDLVQGTITKIVSYGAFLLLPDNTNAMMHISEIASSYIFNISHYLYVGSVYLVKIISVDETNSFYKVSIKQVTEEERVANHDVIDQTIYKFIDFKPLEDKLPEWIDNEIKKENKNA